MTMSTRSQRNIIGRTLQVKEGKWNVKMEVALHGQWKVMTGQDAPAHSGMFRFPLLGDAMYVGELLRGKRHGTGTHIGHSGTYFGDFRNGLMHGVGRREYCDGGIYEGSWKDGKKQGYGKLVLQNGERYEGEFVGGMMHGFGILYLKNGDRYEGGFVNGSMEGDGAYWFHAVNGKYEGEFQGNKMHGEGALRYSSGEDEYVYFGQFERGMMHGRGEMRHACGDAYEGEFKNGAICGHGVYNAASGARYEGSFAAGVPHGEGRFDTGPGHHRGSFREPLHPPFTHVGYWQDGRQHGIGKVWIFDKDGAAETLEGEWKAGRREGSFRHTYPWGRVIEETFRKGERIAWTAAHPQDDQSESTSERPERAGLVAMASGSV